MDAYEIALMMANQDPARPVKMQYGTVSKVGIDSLDVVPDGFSKAVPTVKCCSPLKGDRVVMLANDTERLAVSTLGGESVPPRIGQIFITTTEEDPKVLWPETSWRKLSDCSLFFSGSLGSTGAYIGENSHTLAAGELPSIVYFEGVNDSAAMSPQRGNYPVRMYQDYATNWRGHLNNPDGGHAHNNVQRSLVVNAWLRLS